MRAALLKLLCESEEPYGVTDTRLVSGIASKAHPDIAQR